MGWSVVLLSDCAEQPWRNGGGRTRELLAWPPGQPWRVRVSVASIEQAGAFSRFEGVQRWFAVVQGGGVRLRWPAREVALLPDTEAVYFDGADPPHAELLAGPSLDVNLMLRGPDEGFADAGAGLLRLLRPGESWHSGARWRALYAPHGGRLHDEALTSGAAAASTPPLSTVSITTHAAPAALATSTAAALFWSDHEAPLMLHWDSPHPAWWLEARA